MPVFSKAQEFCRTVSDILARASLRRNGKAYEQIDETNASILAHMHEGFHQSRDAGFARSLDYAKGCVADVTRRVKRAGMRGQVAPAEVCRVRALAAPLGQMLGEFITYLKHSGVHARGALDSE